jgi:nucleoside-diphosphate-sugar epimerase
MEKRILVIGANGFIGRHLVRFLVEKNHRVTSHVLPGTSTAGLTGSKIVQHQVRAGEKLVSVLAGQDFVINLAGIMAGANPQRYHDGNVRTVQELVTALQCIKPLDRRPFLLHVSSVAAIGPAANGIPLREETRPNPRSLYGCSKLLGEREILKRADPMRFMILRPPSLYGPGDRCFLDLFKWAKHGYFPKLITREKRFQLLLCRDFPPIIAQILEKPLPGRVLHIGDSRLLSDTDFCTALERVSGKTLKTLIFPSSLVRLAARLNGCFEAATGIPLLLSPSKAIEMSHPFWLQDFSAFHLAYGRPDCTDFDQGIAQTWNWYKEQKWL